MKGILLAGGKGSRLYPVTRAVSKQLLPIFDKPMFYYPLCTLMGAGIVEVLIIVNPSDKEHFRNLLGDGSNLGMKITYASQPFALGIADALRIGEKFANGEQMALVLGDNLFLGNQEKFSTLLKKAALSKKAVIFTTEVDDPCSFGVAEVRRGRVISIEEKPTYPKSNTAVTGLYFYPPDAPQVAKLIKPSERGELEITDVNIMYMKSGRLEAVAVPNEISWLDTGTCKGLMRAVNMVNTMQDEGNMQGSIELTAYKMGLINFTQLMANFSSMGNSDYGRAVFSCREVSNV